MLTEEQIIEGLEAGKDAFLGTSYAPDPSNGCCWAATGIASYYSPWAANEHRNQVFYVPTLVQHARQDGLLEDFDGTFERGDILVFGDDDHVVVAYGGNSYIGNSSSRGMVVIGNDFNYMGIPLTKIVKTSHA